jgi:hypothetical protein
MVSLGHSRSDLRGECLAQRVHTPGSWDLALRIAKGVPALVGELILQSCCSSRVLHCLKSREWPGFSGDALLNGCGVIDALSTRENALQRVQLACSHGRRAWSFVYSSARQCQRLSSDMGCGGVGGRSPSRKVTFELPPHKSIARFGFKTSHWTTQRLLVVSHMHLRKAATQPDRRALEGCTSGKTNRTARLEPT